MKQEKTVEMPAMGVPADAGNEEMDLFPTISSKENSESKPVLPPPAQSQQTKWYAKPFLKGQKSNPMMSRIKQKVVKVYDLGDEKDIVEYNDLMNKSFNETENISNFKTVQLQFSAQSDTFKALVMYDILEFSNPLD